MGVDVVSCRGACTIGGTIGRAMEGNSVQHSCGLLPGARGAETAPPSIWSKPPEGAKFHPAGFFMSLIGAIVLLVAWRYIR